MTVSTALNKIVYPGNASTTSFPFTFATPAVHTDIQVFFTDAFGNVTLLTEGPGTSQYQLLINAPLAPNPTPVGGTVTYNPLGIPIPLGTSLTILRTLPLNQATSLNNQGTLYQTVTEQALDYEMMVNQQVFEIQSRALVVNVSDPAPLPLPAVAARAGFVLGFDSFGNPIAVSTAPAGVISSAMAPVVGAASLAAGRTAFGLGTAATEAIGLGLQDNGAGSLQTFFGETTDAINQTVTAAFHQNVRVASAAITYTFPLTSTLFNGWGTWIYASGGAVTLAINAADTFVGAATGASLVIAQGSRVFVSTNGAGTWYARGLDLPGMNAPRNLQINAAVGSGNLGIAIVDQNGNNASAASPILFAAATPAANGAINPRAVTGALFITVPSGATLGTFNTLAARIWLAIFDNAGSPVLGVYNSLVAGPSVLCWDESTPTSTTAISAGSTSAQTWYTQGGALTNKMFRIIGYIEITEATAGTWTTGPTKVQLFGPGQKKPGDTVQEQTVVISSSDSFSTATFVAGTNNRISITPVSAANVIRVEAEGSVSGLSESATGTNVIGSVRLSRGTVNNTNMIGPQQTHQANAFGSATVVVGGAMRMTAYDLPNTTIAQAYAVQGQVSGSSGAMTYGANPTFMSAKEIFV